MQLNTYLTFDGNCREAFEFYRSVFGGEFAALQTFGEGPPDMPVPEQMKEQLMHVSLPVGSSVLMGSDNPMGGTRTLGTNFSISVSPDDRAQCEQLFERLSAQGEVTMPLQEVFWGALFGSCKDRFGINWMLNCAL